MDELKEGKMKYDSIKIPGELNERVCRAIQEGEKKVNGNHKKRSYYRIPAAVCAAALCVLVTGLNVNEAFARTMGNVPVIGPLMQILTINSYETGSQEGNVITNIDKPELVINETAGLDEEKVMTAQETAKRVNEEIDACMAEYINDAHLRIEEYKQAFLATGGTEAEWNERQITVDADYEIKAQTNDVLSFVLIYSESWNSVYGETKYYNINLKDGSSITLEELLGEDYAEIIKKQVTEQAEEIVRADTTKMFWILEEDSVYVTEDVFNSPDFYINESGNAVVVFPKYSIAPGSMGACEFEIQQ